MNRKYWTAAAVALVCAVIESTPAVTAASQDASVGLHKAQIYPPIDSAATDIDAGIAAAHRDHKRVILDFGGDWCPDCQVLNYYFQQKPNSELLRRNFVRVNVNIGHIDANQDVAKRYGVALKGVPALAVLDDTGHVVFAQGNDFSDMRHLDSSALTAFLEHWKP